MGMRTIGVTSIWLDPFSTARPTSTMPRMNVRSVSTSKGECSMSMMMKSSSEVERAWALVREKLPVASPKTGWPASSVSMVRFSRACWASSP